MQYGERDLQGLPKDLIQTWGLAGELNYVTFLRAGEKSYGVINGLLDVGGWRQTYDQISLCVVVFGRSKDGLISYYETHGGLANKHGEENGWRELVLI